MGEDAGEFGSRSQRCQGAYRMAYFLGSDRDLLSKGYDSGSEMNQFIMCLQGRHWLPSYRKWVYFSPPLPSTSPSDPHISSGPKK